jgi:chromosome segregation ATPase
VSLFIELQSQEEQYKQELSGLRDALSEEQNKLKKLGTELEVKSGQYTTAIKKMEFEMNQRSLELDKYKTMATDLEKTNETMKTEMSKLRETVSLKSLDVEKANAEKSKLEHELAANKTVLEELEGKVKDLQELESKSSVEISELQSKLTQANQERSSLLSRATAVENDLQSVQVAHAEILIQLNLKRSEKERMEKALEDAKETITTLESTLRTFMTEKEKAMEVEQEMAQKEEALRVSKETKHRGESDLEIQRLQEQVSTIKILLEIQW